MIQPRLQEATVPLHFRPSKLACLTCLLASYALPAAAKEQQVSYAEHLTPLLELADPQFDRLQGVLWLTEADSRHACPGASIDLVDGEQIRHLEIAVDGRVDVPIEQRLADRDAQLRLRKPDSAPPCAISADVTAKLPSGREWRYRDLSETREQMQAYLNRSAGALALFTPKLRGLLIRFEQDPAAKLIIRSSSGEIALQATDGELRLPIDERLSEENPTVILSAPALSVDGWLD